MTTLVAGDCGVRRSWRDSPPRRYLVLAFLSEMMSPTKRLTAAFHPLKSPSDAFMDYLEGYASSLDMFPVCSRADDEHHDIGALVDDFWQVSMDLHRSVGERRRVVHDRPAHSGIIDVESAEVEPHKKAAG